MRIVQAVFGVFHHFELARELERRGHLEVIYSTFPWRRLSREGLPKSRVETFPWIHTPEFLLHKYHVGNRWLYDQLGYANALTFDEWTLRRIPPCDAFIAISGAGLKTGIKVQQRGGRFICDRGSTHIRYRAELVEEEHLRWGVPENSQDDPRDLAREEKIYEVADAITVPSSYSRRTYLDRGIPAEKIHVLPYGVLLDRFQKVADPPSDRFEVLYVGRVSLPKGFPYLIEAFAQLPIRQKHLTVIGGVQPEMERVLEKLPRENITYKGMMPQTQLKEHMSRSHVMVMPSLDEGMALVQGQAMACGCPVIATTNTGAEDLFTDGVEGFIVSIRDSAALAERMRQLAEDSALQKRMSEASLTRVRMLGGWKQYGDGWEQLLRRLTGTSS
ncbi:glycosyltransferase family 4 protein [Edaphobacter flagellatus]|uniref:glycosyltransferase family 4 protein n=1 Tax=Edaphobacter flagellatus TaxID=1933044 RepID=UPI0021B1813F|nr:glycosyltransferase family 4 protein [Edaphobacter flagellatus]